MEVFPHQQQLKVLPLRGEVDEEGVHLPDEGQVQGGVVGGCAGQQGAVPHQDVHVGGGHDDPSGIWCGDEAEGKSERPTG